MQEPMKKKFNNILQVKNEVGTFLLLRRAVIVDQNGVKFSPKYGYRLIHNISFLN